MSNIHGRCVAYRTDAERAVNYVEGAGIAGFVKVGEAMVAYGMA